MKVLTILSVATAATAFVLPDQFSIGALRPNEDTPAQDSVWDKLWDPERTWEELEERFKHTVEEAKDKFNDAIEYVEETTASFEDAFSAVSADAWNSVSNEYLDWEEKPPHKGPHKGPPHHGPPHHGPPHHGPPHRGPHRPPHHGPPNQTVYELISKSKYTTKLAKLINEYPDLVETLNGTKANYTVFAPTNRAFDKIPEKAPKPSKEFLKQVLLYHVSPKFYPAGRVLVSKTIPMAAEARYIKGFPQRVSTQISPRGLTLNFYARVVAIDIFGTNGVIHGIDHFLLPPPKLATAISAFPGEFSTLELALRKTGLWEALNDTTTHVGGTLFAPSNEAFKRLGPRLNAFLFSKYGEKYLKAVLEYHACANITLYSDAIYKADEDDESVSEGRPHHRIPKGLYHIDLPTALKGKKLSIDIARYGRLLSFKINGFVRAGPLDACLSDAVGHVVPFVLIPPKELAGSDTVLTEDMSVEDLKERLAPFVGEDVEDDYDEEL